MSQEAQDVMAHEAVLQTQRAALQAGQNSHTTPKDRARLLETVIETELVATDDALDNLKAKDFPLSNFDEETDTIEFKWMQEILDIFVKARYPHPRSGLTGLARAWATGDRSDRRHPLGLDEFAQDETYKLGTYSRSKRGEGMAQQETSAKQVTETHAVHDNGQTSKGGIMARLPWR